MLVQNQQTRVESIKGVNTGWFVCFSSSFNFFFFLGGGGGGGYCTFGGVCSAYCIILACQREFPQAIRVVVAVFRAVISSLFS